jgi:tripartite-type tricarboxylate transporter receptor subunit TctC
LPKLPKLVSVLSQRAKSSFVRGVAGALPLLAAAAAFSSAHAEDPVAQFYKGKDLTIVIGSSAGGGYDLYGRLVARNIGRFIPGHPNVIATNMSGAASSAAAQYIYNTAPKDGTFMALIYPGGVMAPLLSDKGPLHYDPTKFNYIGSANADAYVCIDRADTRVKNLDDAKKHQIIMGASAAGSSTHDFAMLLNNEIGTKFKIVTGYAGSNEISLAIEKGEVQGACGLGWSSILSPHPQWIRDKFINVLAEENMRRDPELKKLGVPLAISYAKTPEERQIMSLFYTQPTFGRPFVMAPEAPADRVAAMRTAFQAALSDPEAIAEAKKERLELYPMWGTELQKTVTDLYATPPGIVAKAKKAVEDPR